MTIYNSTIRTQLAAKQDFQAHVLILRQRGISEDDAKFQAWSAGPERGRLMILEWMQESATGSAELKRPDLEREKNQ